MSASSKTWAAVLTIFLVQPELFDVDLPSTEKIGIVEVGHTPPERSWEVMQRMEIAIIYAIAQYSADDD